MEEREEKGATEPVSFFQEKRVIVVAAIVLIADQLTKQIVVNTIDPAGQVILIEGFLKFVNWHNTGAAWSQFQGKSLQLAAISLVALGALIHYRHHFLLRPIRFVLLGSIISRLFEFLRGDRKLKRGNETGAP